MIKQDQLRDGLDAFLGDMAGMQSQPTPDRNQRQAVELFVEKENRGDFDLADTSPLAVDSPIEIVEDRNRRLGRGMQLVQSIDDGPEITLTEYAELMRVRLELLLTKEESEVLGRPSWRTRTLAVLSLHPADKRCAPAMADLCESSNAKFGRWDKRPERKIILI